MCRPLLFNAQVFSKYSQVPLYMSQCIYDMSYCIKFMFWYDVWDWYLFILTTFLLHTDKNNDKFLTIFCIWVYWSLIESLTQFDEIFGNFLDLSMFCILSITFSTDLGLTLSLYGFVDNSKIYKRWKRLQDQIWIVKWTNQPWSWHAESW